MGLPVEVRHGATIIARRTGIDIEDAESIAAEAWWVNGERWDGFTFTCALRRSIDERRKVSGRTGTDRRPLVILDEPAHLDDTATVGEIIAGDDLDPALANAETIVDLGRAIGDLPDDELAALARAYWLHTRRDTNACARAIRHARNGGAPQSPQPPANPEQAPCQLTPRQRQVLRLIADGHTYEAAASALHVSHNTVKTTVQNALKRINADSAAHAVAIAMRNGWID